MKHSFFQAAAVSILLYGCTTWTLTKCMKKKFDGNYTGMQRAILNKSWRQYPTKPIQDIALKTYRERWTIEKEGGRGTGRSVLVARHDDDGDDMYKNGFGIK